MSDCSECKYIRDCWFNAGLQSKHNNAEIRARCSTFVEAELTGLKTTNNFIFYPENNKIEWSKK